MTQALAERPEVEDAISPSEKAKQLQRELTEIADRSRARHAELIKINDQITYWANIAPMIERSELAAFRSGKKPAADPNRPPQSADTLQQVRRALRGEETRDEERMLQIKSELRKLELAYVNESRSHVAKHYLQLIEQLGEVYANLIAHDGHRRRMKEDPLLLLAIRNAEVLHLPIVEPTKHVGPESYVYGRPHPSTLALHGSHESIAHLAAKHERDIASQWQLLSGGQTCW